MAATGNNFPHGIFSGQIKLPRKIKIVMDNTLSFNRYIFKPSQSTKKNRYFNN